jgi:hypothetical protein
LPYLVTPLAAFALSGAFDKWDAIKAPNLSGPAPKFVRGPERTSGLRSCQVRVVLVPPAAARS